MKNLRALLLFFFLFHTNISIAQDPQIERLKKYIETAPNDSTKVDTLIELSKQYQVKSPDGAIHFADMARELSEKIKYGNGLAKSIKSIGNAYYNKGNYVESISYWQKALALFDSLGNKNGVANIQSNLGAIYFNQGEDTKANEYYFAALKIGEEIQDTLRITTTLNNIAAVYQRKKNTQEKAKEFYLRAIPFEMELDPLDKADLYGSTTAGLGQYYFERDSGNTNITTTTFDSALHYTNISLEMRKGTVDEPYVLNQLGLIYRVMKDFDKAIQYQKRAIEIAKKYESVDDIALSYVGLAKTYLKQGDKKLALATFKEAEKTANETKAIYSLRDIYEGQSKIYSMTHDYVNTAKYQYLLLGVKDSIYNIETDQKLQGIQFTFDIQKKEGEIALLTKDKQIQEQEVRRQKMVKNSFVGGFAVVLVFAGIFFNQRNRISKEKKRSDELLLNILPSETAEELKATGTAKAKSFDMVTVMFTDFKNFTQASEILTPEELVKEINHCYSEFDKIITKYGIEKIKTIGDSYMCAGGLPATNSTHPVDVVKAGLEMQQFIEENKSERITKGQPYFDLRLGIHTGPVVAGIVGIKKFAYDIWGDTVNTASRMESSGQIGKVNISGTTFELVKNNFNCTHRGKVQAKNKGEIEMYFVDSLRG
jgi:adenylate cyclase